MKRVKFACFALAGVCAFGFLPCEKAVASANSAPAYWEGVNASGAIVRGENCPVTVEKEVLTLTANDFPAIEGAREEAASYRGSVTAEYTFYNPADYAVNVKLLFPFGEQPDYGWNYLNDAGEYLPVDDSNRYAITVDGETVSYTVRHTLSSYPFDTETGLSRLCDEKKEDAFFTQTTPVTVYEMEIRNISASEFYLSGKFTCNPQKTRVIASRFHSRSREEDGERVGAQIYSNGEKTFTVAVIGEQENVLPQFYLYQDYTCAKKLAGNVAVASQTNSTFSEYVLSLRAEESGVSETDWYNAFVDDLNACGETEAVLSRNGISLENRLTRWFEYELNLSAGARCVNRVTAPLYPTVDGSYSSSVYRYEYFLSPAEKWADFGELEIAIETPYYMMDSSLEGFERSENGYVLKRQGLPQGELTFSLCEEENPAPLPRKGGLPTEVTVLIVVLIGIVVLAAGIGIFFAVKKARKRRPEVQADGTLIPKGKTESRKK